MYRLWFLCFFLSSFLWAQDILIQVNPVAEHNFAEEPLKAGEIHFSVTPLHVSKNERSELGKNWYVASAQERSLLSSWDLAHQLVRENSIVEYAEPNRPFMNEHYQKLSRALSEQDRSRYDDNWGYPNPDVFAWHLKDSHSQLGKARQESTHKGGKRIRVAHFDTGYSPINITTPENVRQDLEKNFVAGEKENSAIDPGKKGFLEQPGHGTSTLSILAGGLIDLPQKKFKGYLGGAPEVEIIPMRLSNTVILLQVDVFAKALFHAIETDCDVVAMSMGGVASKLWAEAINQAYEKGITVVTAAGNNVLRAPTHYLIYPAKFKRVVAVCGVNYDHKPYFKEDSWFIPMQGNWGPEPLMKSAIAAYTPNMTSARFSKPNEVGSSGGGTSSATPQVAAAAALWLQKYKDFPFDQPWQRVNAVRHALFSAANKDFPNSKKYFGNGVLRASDALKVEPKIDTTPIAQDKVSSPYLSVLFGWETLSSTLNQEMIEMELLRLEQGNPELCEALEKLAGKNSLSKAEKKKIRMILERIPEVSQTFMQAFSK